MEDETGGCDQHHQKFAGKKHPDFDHKEKKGHLPEHQRGAAHPAHHTRGRMRSQLQPDHGPHE